MPLQKKALFLHKCWKVLLEKIFFFQWLNSSLCRLCLLWAVCRGAWVMEEHVIVMAHAREDCPFWDFFLVPFRTENQCGVGTRTYSPISKEEMYKCARCTRMSHPVLNWKSSICQHSNPNSWVCFNYSCVHGDQTKSMKQIDGGKMTTIIPYCDKMSMTSATAKLLFPLFALRRLKHFTGGAGCSCIHGCLCFFSWWWPIQAFSVECNVALQLLIWFNNVFHL